MQPYVCDLSPYSLPKKIFYLASSISIAEILTYPFDRIKTLLYARPHHLTQSLFGYREFHLTALEITNADKFFGLFYGLKVGFDRTFSLLLPKFFIFYYMMNKRKAETLSYFELFRYSVIAHTLGGFIVQMSNVLKVKLQTDINFNAKKVDSISMKYRAMSEIYSKDPSFLFRCGLGSSLLSINVMGLAELYGFLMFKNGFDAIFGGNQQNQRKTSLYSVILASVLATAISNPFEFLHHRIVLEELKERKIGSLKVFIANIRKQAGLKAFYHGFLPNLLRNCCFNTILVWILLRGIAFEERKEHLKGFRHYDRYEHE